MRKIEQEMINAIFRKQNWQSKKTSVRFVDGSREVRLHGNLIEKDGAVVRSTLRNYPTRTTCSRLRALGHNVRISKGVPLLNGQPA